jgi:RimK family alpha-L-glutamate ligase
MRRMALIAARPTDAGDGLARVAYPGLRVEQMTPDQALAELVAGDVAVGRLDVRRTLDGVDDGLWSLGVLEARGVTVLNSAAALLATHDKLLTARLLDAAGVRHPRTSVFRAGARPRLDPPVVVKPRFGSWGHDVLRCDDDEALTEALTFVGSRDWFGARGALVQELVPPAGYDIRILVANGQCVGAISRVAARGEWRTNVALGAQRVPVDPPADAVALAVATAQTLGTVLVGVDLLPAPDGGWIVVEANGAVEFARPYAARRDVFYDTVAALAAAADAGPRPSHASFGAQRRPLVDGQPAR